MDAHVRGAQRVSLEKSATAVLESPVWIQATTRVRNDIRIGAFTYVRGVTMLANCASIGRYCSLATGVRVGEAGHPTTWLSSSPFQYKPTHFGWHSAANDCTPIDPEAGGRASFRGRPAVIGNDVWIADNAIIRHGVRIGDGAIVAAGAVVVDDVPPYTIVGGVPAKPLHRRFPAAVIDALLDLAWWRYSPNQLSGVPFDDIDAAIGELRRRIDGGLEPYAPLTVTLGAEPAPPTDDKSRKRRFARRETR